MIAKVMDIFTKKLNKTHALLSYIHKSI